MVVTSTVRKENNVVELTVSVGAEELKSATDKVFRGKVKDISVPGFRKGKAPRSIIEKVYGEGVFIEDAVNELYPKAYGDAVDETGIEPVDRADVEVLNVDKESGFTFKATVTVKPEVELGKYKSLEAEKTVYTVNDKDVDAEVERMRERNARIISVSDRPAANGDSVVIDFEGFTDGKPFDGGKAEDYNITLGSHSFIDTFEQQIEGHNIGDEFDVNVTFPEDYHAENLKGKPALFKVKLTEIKGKELPELDDEFAKDVSEFDTLDELRADILEKQKKSFEARSADEFETRLLDLVIGDMKADIPDCMVSSRIDEMVKDFEYRLSSQGMKLDMYLGYANTDMESFRASFADQALRQVKIRLALEKIAALEAIEPTSEDVEAEYSKAASMYNMDVEKIKGFIPEKDIKADIKTTKALDFVRDSAIPTETPQKTDNAEAPKAAKKTKKAEAPKEESEALPKKKPAAKKAVKKPETDTDAPKE